MTKIKSIEDIKKLHIQCKSLLNLRNMSHDIEVSFENKRCKREVLICAGTGCKSSNSQLIVDNLKKEIELAGLSDDVTVSITGCFGFCEKGPIVKITPDNVFYIQVKPEDAKEIVDSHLLKGVIIKELLYEEPTLAEQVKRQDEMSFYKKQYRIALRNCGLINPEKIEEAIGADGYMALAKVLTTMSSEDVIKLISDSGLRGRGGGGFPTGRKWSFASQYNASQKYIICNADEGDPGAFMDRSILEGDPHSIIEAMAIAGYAIGASIGYIYIRAEYPLAIHRLRVAIEQAREYGLLGKDILSTGFDFDVDLKYGAGAFVCGEETALIHSIEGNRGEPSNKPPFPAENGLWNRPTCVNNVETLANIPAIINKGYERYLP